MTIPFTPWPTDLASRYRERGYWIDRPLTDIVAQHADSEACAVICGEQQLSYRALNQRIHTLATSLLQLGIQPGQTALVQLGNVAEFYITFFALLKAGIVPVNALFSHQKTELAAYAELVGPSLIIADRSHRLFAEDDYWRALRDDFPHINRILLRGEPSTRTAGIMPISLDAAIEGRLEGLSAQPKQAEPTPASDVAFFQLSGGSTGTPKLIPRTHNDYDYSIRRSVELCGVSAATRFLCALPAPHNYPLSSPGALGIFHAGGCVVLAEDPAPQRCFPLIERHHVTMVALVPPAVTLWEQSLTPENRHQLDSLEVMQIGGAHLAVSLAERVPERFGCQLQQVFGMAEGLVNYTLLDDDEWHRTHTQGRPMSPDDEVYVVDDNGRPVPPNTPGHLIVRGPYTFRGYYRAPLHNEAAFTADGFYSSGDIVEMTPDGYLKVVGREKDQINRGGEKIAAEEIENLLLRHDDIIEVALVSVPDEVMGEKSCAVVVARQPLKAAPLRRWLRTLGVADYKLPDRFHFVEALPQTAVGKIDKRALRDALSA